MLFWLSYGLLWLMGVVLFFAVLLLYRHHGEMMLARGDMRLTQGPEINSHVFPKLRLKFQALGYGEIRSAFRLLFFASPQCGPCKRALVPLKDFSETHYPLVETFVVCRGSREDATHFACTITNCATLLADPDWELGRLARVTATPFALLIDQDGFVRAKGMPDSEKSFEWFADQVRKLAPDQVKA